MACGLYQLIPERITFLGKTILSLAIFYEKLAVLRNSILICLGNKIKFNLTYISMCVVSGHGSIIT